MSWTAPTTEKQLRYYSTHAPVRKLFRWLVWAWLAIWAVMDFKGFETLFTENLAGSPLAAYQFPLVLGILAVLHVSLFVTARTFLFARLDDKFAETDTEKAEAQRTDFSVLIPLAITAIMLFASQQGSHAIFESMAPKAVITSTAAVDTGKLQGKEAEKKQLDYDLSAIDALYTDLVKTAERPHRDAIARHRRSIANLKWDEKARKATLLAQIRNEETDRDKATAALLAEKAVKQQNTMQRYESAIATIDATHKTATADIEATNLQEKEAEMSGRAAASRYSWLVSVLLAGLFWGTLYRLVQINLLCGIRPHYPFNEFDKSGGPWTWMQTAVTDAFKRQMFRLSVWLHGTLSSGARELPKMDGRVSFTEPEDFDGPPTLPEDDDDDRHKVRRLYSLPANPAAMAMNGHERPVTENAAVTVTAAEPVITTVLTDRKAQLAYHLQRIQQYHAKWKSPKGGATKTIIFNLIGDWEAAFKIMGNTPPEALGEQAERCHRLADMDIELFSSPRPRDVKKATA